MLSVNQGFASEVTAEKSDILRPDFTTEAVAAHQTRNPAGLLDYCRSPWQRPIFPARG